MFGPGQKTNGDYEVQRGNSELLKLCEGEDIVKEQKAQRLSWAGQVAGMDGSETQKAMLNYISADLDEKEAQNLM